jgi:hypothetical protein
VLTVQVPGGPDLLWRTPPLSGELIRCQSDHGDYACSHGGVAMSCGDGMDSSSQVSTTRCTWVPVVMSHYLRNSNRGHRSETCAKAIVSDLKK